MGSVVKHVTGALTGHSGGSSSKSEEKATSNNSSQSWLENNPQYQALQNNALAEAANFNMPDQQIAGMTPEEKQALATLSKGVDASGYKTASDYLQQTGQSNYEKGTSLLGSATSQLQGLNNLSQTDLQNMMKSEYNSDLVNQQIAEATGDIHHTYLQQVQGLNQDATMHGAMGSSRAGVAQGVMAGQEQKAIGSASVQYRTAEESAATNRLMNYLNLKQNTAGQLAGIGQNQQSTGLNMYGQGMNYFSQHNQAITQNAQNQLTAGNAMRQYQQQVMDVQRQNSILQQSPALARLSFYNQTMLPMANLSTTGTNSGTSTTTQNEPGKGGNLLGGLMGMGGSALGTYFGGATGGSIGGAMGGAFGNTYGR